MKWFHPAAIAVAFLWIHSGPAMISESCRAQDAQKEMAEKLAEVCRKHDVPAMAFAVVNGGGLIQSQCFGNRKRGSTDKVELSDRFPIGSNTKSMTATLAAVLVEAGKIDWDTTIGEVWPKASEKAIHPKMRSVTLDQLLSHQSGLPDNISGPSWASFFEEKESPTQERRRMMKLLLSEAPKHPQGKFHYSNLGYVVASAMLETRGQDAFESLMKKYVFDPLKMDSADFRSMKTAERLQEPLLWGHKDGGVTVDPRVKGAENPSVYAAAGTVHVSIEDYAKYARWHVAKKPEPLLRSQESVEHLHKPQVGYSLPGAQYGCGWICVDQGQGLALNHAGSNTNTFALIWVLLDADLAAVVCTNTGERQAFPACNEMIGHLLNKWSGSAKSTQPQNKPIDGGSSVAAERLVGRYQLAPNFVFDVKLRDGRVLVGITNQPTQEVFAESPTVWAYRGVDAKLEFHLPEEGPAYALTLHQNGIAQKAKRLAD